jgi:Ran GTPase-activating protein (RanGAP) involved in mRNA processing and transport
MPLNAQLLEQLSSVTSLDLSRQSLTDEDITQLAQALSTNTRLTSLNVSLNHIGAEGAKALSTNTTLTSLNVSLNHIGAEGAKALSTNTTLTSLNVECNQIGDEGAKALSTNTTLTSLNVSLNQIGDEGVKALSTNPHLTSLSIDRNNIGDEGAKALSTNTHLTSLNVGRNEIGDEGAKALSMNPHLTSLNVSGNEIGAEGAKAFSTNPHLTSLNVGGNEIGDETQRQIAQMLAANKGRQWQRRNGFLLTLGKGFTKAHALAGTPTLPLPPELLGHIGAFLDAGFYLQLVHIQQPAHINKTEHQVYQCVLLLLHQLATGQVAQGSISEQRPHARQALDYHQHLLFKPTIHLEVVEPPAEKPRREPEEPCAIL